MNINQVSSIHADLSGILEKIREVSTKSSVFSTESKAVSNTNAFSNVMDAVKSSIQTINHTQQNTEALKNAYLAGDQNVSMSQVVVAAEKSKLAFEGLVVVRNKLLEAYKEIMNTPV